VKVLLDIKDNKAHFLLEILKDLPYVKIQVLTSYKAQVLENLSEAVEEMKLIKANKLTARNA
jgi:hypothetical protein